MEFHPEIKEKLSVLIKNGKIPNIIFHGPHGSGKRSIVRDFINDIYRQNKDLIKDYVMYVNCAHGKGIKFVREELKFFAKSNINVDHFKTIVLSNADDLTIDAQSALRRCIERFSHTTRFFIIVNDKYKILKPILSRLCEIFIAEPEVKGKHVNLHKLGVQHAFKIAEHDKKRDNYLTKLFQDVPLENAIEHITQLASELYESGYSGLDLLSYIEHQRDLAPLKKYQMLLVFNKIKREFRNERLFILYILNILLLRSECDLENISFM
jgi:DNA polymerase III delta prime subunit